MPAHRRLPSPEELAALPHLSNTAAALQFGVAVHTVTRWRYEQQKKTLPTPPIPAIAPEAPVEGKKADIPPRVPVAAPMDRPTRLVVAGDAHVPFHDVAAERAFRSFLRIFRPDVCVLAGDILDCYQLSHFERDPRRRFTLADDIAEADSFVGRITDALPVGCRKIFLEGNHEDRLRRYLWQHAAELFGIQGLTLPEWLHLRERGWEFVAAYDNDQPGIRLWNLLVVHGLLARKWSGATAKGHFERLNFSGVSGHSHRIGSFFHRAYGGQYAWFESGCLCSLNPPYSSSPDWANGFIAGYVWAHIDPDNPRFDLHPVFLHHGRFAWEGVLYGEEG